MMRRVLLIALCLMSATASAHGGSQHVLGTVTAIDEKHIEVRTQKGKAISVKLTKQARFKDTHNPKSTDRPAVGDRVVIEVLKENKVLIATEVHYSAAKRVPSAAE